MATQERTVLPPLSPEQRRAATGQFERANQVIATGNYDYGIRLLLACCRIDPGNLIYRHALRRAEKTKYRNNMRGSSLAWLTTWRARLRLKTHKRTGDSLAVLETAEEVLLRNPWDVGAQMDMAEAAEELGLLDLAVWLLEQARQTDPRSTRVNRTLARLYERRGNFTQAMALWNLVYKANPLDKEAQDKAKDLAASQTIARMHEKELPVEAEATAEEAALEDTGPAVEPAPKQPSSAELPALGAATKRGSSTEHTPLGTTNNKGSSAEHRPLPSSSRPPSSAQIDLSDRSPVSPEKLAREAPTLRSRIQTDPTNAVLYLQLSNLYRRAGQPEQAHEVLAQGLAASAHHFEMTAELLDLEIEPFRRDLAITEQKLQENPNDQQLRHLQAQLAREINSRELELYRRRSERYPTDMQQHFELGVRLLRAGQLDEAIRELQTTRSDPKLQWRSLFYLGFCFRGRNNWRLARRNFEDALKLIPPAESEMRKETLLQLAQCAAESGDLTAALAWAHELANLDFGYKNIGCLLDDWQARLQQA